jgi:excisionase family DNA binding protein
MHCLMVTDDLLTLGEAVRLLRISNRALRDLCKKRGIAHVRVNRTTWLFRREVLNAWIDKLTVLPR